MTDLHVEGTPGEAVTSLIDAYRGLSDSAGSISRAELADRTTAELAELRQAVAAGAVSGDNDFADWCTRTDQLIVAESYQRLYAQAAVDAKAAAIIDEERRLACEAT